MARLLILLATYLLIAVQQVPFLRLNRPAAALLGAVAMVTIGGLPLRDAYAAIDLDVMVFLLGVLLLTGYLEVGGFFDWAVTPQATRRTCSSVSRAESISRALWRRSRYRRSAGC